MYYHLFDDLSVLLRLSSSSTGEGSSRAVEEEELVYSRADLCEVESAILTSIVLTALKYIMELEAVEKDTLNNHQLHCYSTTVKAVQMCLLPSLQFHIIEYNFIDHLLSSTYSPLEVVDILNTRLTVLLSDAV